jgi:tRNA-modifying protein YgfZ
MSEPVAVANDANVAGVFSVDRALIDCTGPDTVRFLHSLLSQDVESLEVGARRLSFLLSAQGKIVALLGVTRAGSEWVVLDTDPGVGEALHTTLSRYRIRTKCTLRLALARCPVWFVPGPDGSLLDADVLGNRAGRRVPASDGVISDASAFETARLTAGWPSHGTELTDDTIPNELGLLPEAVNFRKGCYVGQELVERIDARGGSTPYRLARLLVPSLDGLGPVGPLPQARTGLGEVLDAVGSAVGSVSGLAPATHGGMPAAIALVRLHRRALSGVALSVRVGAASAAAQLWP